MTVYTGLIALAVNLLVVVVGSLVLRAPGAPARATKSSRPRISRPSAATPASTTFPATPDQEAEPVSTGRL